jgi:CRISPR-associated exonuclease Cas4
MCQKLKFSEQRGITGNHFFDYGSCYTRLWIANKRIIAGIDNVHIQIGRYIDEKTKPSLRKSLTIQGLCAIDYVEENQTIEVHEIKKGHNPSGAHKLQLLFYLEVMYELTGFEPVGMLHLPQSKKVVRVERDRETVSKVYTDILRILSLPCPKPEEKPICSGCRYSEMCWA